MNLFKKEVMSNLNVAGVKRKTPTVVYSKKRQTGERLDVKADKKRKALPAGKRISKSGKPYYEYRKNRTDIAFDL